MSNTFTSWQDAPITDRLQVYDCYCSNPDDHYSFEEFNAIWRNYSFHYVKNLFPAD